MTRSINTPDKALLTLQDVLRLTGLSDPTWRTLQASDNTGRMPKPVALPGRARYRRSDVLSLARRTRHEEHTMNTDNPGLPDDLIGLAEACRLLPGIRPGKRLHIATLYRWTQQGTIPAWKIGRATYVSRSDVLAMCKPMAVQPKPVPAIVRNEEHRRAVEYLKREHNLDCG